METPKKLIYQNEYLALDNEGKEMYAWNPYQYIYELKKQHIKDGPLITALAVDQAPEVRELGITYEDVARNLNNFAAVLKFLRGNCDKPDSRSLASLLSAITAVNDVMGIIREDKEKQPELSLTPAAKKPIMDQRA
jgi:hypothetical protein